MVTFNVQRCPNKHLYNHRTAPNRNANSCRGLTMHVERNGAMASPSVSPDEMIGRTFGRLTVVALTDKRTRCRFRIYLCRCECGAEREVPGAHLRNETVRSCGCIMQPNLTQILRDRVEVSSNGCWIWRGVRGQKPFDPTKRYAAMRMSNQRVLMHRWIYQQLRGPIPEGKVLDHLCRTPGCVNPDHLEAVTERENILRGVSSVAQNARKTCCSKGHPFDEANTYISKSGGRTCKTCNRDSARAYQRRCREKERAE